MRGLCKSLPVCLVLLAVVMMVPVVSAQSDEPASVSQSSGDRATVATGELQSVDTSNQTFTIKDTKGEQMQFSYDSNTQVEGSSQGVQGLSSETGTRVTVHYEEKSGQKTATKIVIHKSKSNG